MSKWSLIIVIFLLVLLTQGVYAIHISEEFQFEEKDLTVLDKSPRLMEEKNLELKIEEIPVNQIKEHTVKQGESLWNIARGYNIDMDTLIGANDINDIDTIRPGDKITILPIKGILYKVNPGESISSVINKFDISLDKVISANGIQDTEPITPGTMLLLPGAKPKFGYKDRIKKRFIRPVPGHISSHFGRRWGKMHEGVDFPVCTGTSVKAAGSGRVTYSGWVRGYGKTIIIEHQQGFKTLYAHNSQLLVQTGKYVSVGEIIAKSGNTGNSTGPHLHFEVQVNGRPVNPINYFR
ncbi:MAG: peptidoglycan DD-metalloendopeptidase family protein [Halanaerobiaceae bacterium]